jgi:hypothetical protein
VIGLSDGRICYVDTVQASHDFSPERSVTAVVDIRGRLRFETELPASWEAMQEAELRRRIELALHASAASDAQGAPLVSAAAATAPVPRDTRGFLARLFDLWSPAPNV